jgi:hypothetical protein
MANGGPTLTTDCKEARADYSEAWFERGDAEKEIKTATEAVLAAQLGMGAGGMTMVAGVFSPWKLFTVIAGGAVVVANYIGYKRAKEDLAAARQRCLEARRAMVNARYTMQLHCPDTEIPPYDEIATPCG